MSKPEHIISAGKMMAAVAGSRALKGRTLKVQPEELLSDPTLERQGVSAPKGPEAQSQRDERAKASARSDPGNPNDLAYEDQDPGQEQAGQT